MSKALFVMFSMLVILAAMPQARGGEEKFMLVVVPDTQREVKTTTTVFRHRYQWIAAMKDDFNIKFVAHTGDLVDWDTPDHIQFVRADEGYDLLDEVQLPYAISPGNHDTAAVDVGGGAKPGQDTHANLRDTRTFNAYFPTTRHRALAGVYEAGKSDNAYHTFSAGGLNWLVISLEFCCRPGVVTWVDQVLQAHPNHNAIIVTHYFLEGNNTISTSNAGYGDTSGRYLYDNALRKHANVRMIFSGHVGVQGYRTDVGNNGNTIYEFLGTYHASTENPTRLVEIDTVNNSINTRVYVPSTGLTKNDGSMRTITGINWIRPPATPVPTAPSALSATATSASQINLAWNDNASNETGFKIERKTGSGGAWGQIATVGANVKTYSNTGLSASTQYFYRVRANNSGGDSGYSNEANATTQAAPQPVPTAPSNMVATATSSTTVRLTWTDNSNNEANFKLEGKTGATGNWNQIATPVANSTSWNGANLTPGTQYFFRIRATNASGDSAFSNESGVTLPPNPVVGTGTGLRGEYFDNMDFTGFKLSRIDPYVDFAWSGAPEASVSADTFSVTWRGEVQAQYTTTYTFSTLSDDGIRLWVNGVKLIDNWTDHSEAENTGTIALTAGQKYAVRIEYYENGVSARVQLAWQCAFTAKQTIPTSQLYPAAANSAPALSSGITAAPNPATTNDTVNFTAAASDANGDALGYTWNFGDGTTGSGASTSRKYASPGNYTASVSVNDGRGGVATGSVTVTVNTPVTPVNVRVNFQLAGGEVPAGYLTDNGAVFGNRGNGFSYGWNADNSLSARDRNAANSPDQRYDTLLHMHKPENPNAWWDIALPNGTYSVRVVCGDPSYFNSAYKVNVEGVSIVDGTPSETTRWFEGTRTVTLADGRLTIGSSAGSVNNKLCFVEITNGVAAREAAADAPSAEPLTVTRLQLGLNFARTGADTYRVAGELTTLPADFAPGNVALSIDVGAAIVDMVLDSKGRARGKSGTAALKFDKNKGWLFQAALGRGAWSGAWSDGELTNTTVRDARALVPVTLTLGTRVFGGSKTLSYTAKGTKSGAAK